MDAIEKRARELLASCLDEWGHHQESENVRGGEDLESYELELRLIGQLLRFGFETGSGREAVALTPPEGYVLVPVEVQKNAERYEWLRDNQSCSISIEHNYHHLSYENAAEALDEPQGYYAECPEEERKLMIEADSIWTIHEYPNTPVGFNTWHGASLDRAIDSAMLAARPEVL